MKKLFRNTSPEKISILGITILYVIWSLIFIYRSSFIAMDGKRYFNLFDDAMVSMRYAWNFSHGSGLIWNAGQRVEGYSNLLMTLLMSLVTLLFNKRYAVLVIQLTGICFMLGTAFLTLTIFQTLRVSKTFWVSKYLLFIVILLYYPLNYWSLLGMETGLLAFLLSAGVLCSLLYVEKQQTKYLWLMSLSFGLAYLTRNDSFLFAALAFLYSTQVLKSGRRTIYVFLAAGLTYGLFVIGQTVFRYFYYGQILPNTYTLKLVGMPLMERLKNGWGFIQLFLKETSFILLFVAIGFFIKASKQKLYLAGFFLISVTYQVYIGGDPWLYWRIMAPSMPFIFILFTTAGDEILSNVPKVFPSFTHCVLLIILAFTGLYLTDSRFLREISFLDFPYTIPDLRLRVDRAIAINAVTEKNATIGVIWAGALPYYADRSAIDFLGKSDKHIANLPPDTSGSVSWYGMESVPGHNKYDLDYSIKELRPTYVERFHWGRQDLTAWAKDNYVRVRYRSVNLYLLKDSPDVHWSEVQITEAWNR